MMRSALFKAAFINMMVTLVCVSPVSAQELRDVVAAAIQSHPTIDGARSGYKAAEQGVSTERSNFFPELSMSATGGRVYQDNATSRGLTVTRGAAYSGLGEGNIALRQPLFDGFETVHRVDAAEKRAESLEYRVLDTEDQIALRVAQSYIDILRIRSVLALLSEQSKSIDDYESRITDMVKEGVSDEAEFQQARDVSMIIDGVRAEYEGQLQAARAAYTEASGLMPPEGFFVPPSLSSYMSDDVDSVVEYAKANHPALVGAEIDAQAVKQDLKAETAKLYPDISSEVSYYKTDKRDLVGGEAVDARAVVRMNWNFSTGGAVLSSMKEKKYQYSEMGAKHDDLERQIELGIRQAYANYQTFQKKLAIAKDRVDLNDKLVDAYKVQFDGARITLLSLMRAESQLYSARLEEVDNTYNLLASEYAVVAAVGDLKGKILSQPKEQAH